MILSEAKIRVYVFAFGCGECCKSHVPCSDVGWCQSFARWSARYEHLVAFGAVVSKMKYRSISCDQSVSYRIEVIMTVSHLVRVLLFRDVGDERFHFVTIDQLAAGLLVTSQICLQV